MFRHCRVVFGVSCSLFILGAVLNMRLENALKSLDVHKSGKFSRDNIVKLMRSFYVDNCVTSVNSVEQLSSFINDAKAVMASGSCDLRGWEHTRDNSYENQTGVLGILWDRESDTLSLKVNFSEKLDSEKVTKRSILSVAHRIFDPLGFAAPAVLFPRLLLQETWAQKLSWDQELSGDIKMKFLKWAQSLRDLSEIKVPRCLFGNITEADKVTLHTFCDANKVAYAAVIFLRVETESGIRINFVQAKSRVAPVTNVNSDARASIPRLELLAATIGARLTASVLESFKDRKISVYYWSDSTTVLTWIHKESNWATFVWNRVTEIRKLSSPEKWRHVPGQLNPADLPSRGCTVDQLVNSRWWEGPEWLKLESENWPADISEYNDQEANKELKKSTQNQKVCRLLAREEGRSWFLKFSDYVKVKRVLGWVKRFCNNVKLPKKSRVKTKLSCSEIEKAEVYLLKMEQEDFKDGEQDIRIRHLQPFKDNEGLLRLKTKIILREDSYNFRCPIVIPGVNDLVSLIIRGIHVDLQHAGVEIVLNAVREKFWILKGRKVIRAVISKCADCRRHDAKPLIAEPAPLPINRVRDAAIFEVLGVDFAGPLFLKGGQKAWVCIFTCAVFRAVNFELVTSLSTAAFLMALQRHIGRRGRPSVVYSDNGTNFVGLNNLFKNINFEKIASKTATKQIKWIFNPPTAAWWGGFWERLIGVLKRLLRRTLKKSCLNYEEMATVLVDCEAVINSRPLTFLSDNAHDIVPLTPLMFLQEVKEIGVLDLDFIECNKLEKRYEYRQRVKNDLRRRFRSEYLGALVHKLSTERKNLGKCR